MSELSKELNSLKSDVQSLEEYLKEFEERVRSDSSKRLEDHIESLIWLYGESRFLIGKFRIVENTHPDFKLNEYTVFGKLKFIEERSYNLLDFVLDGELELGESQLYKKHPLEQSLDDRF
jgi:hypothetical protein